MKEAKGFKDGEEPSGGKKVALPLRRLLKTSVWVLSVHTTTASLFVSHQGHRSTSIPTPSTHSLSTAIST